MNREGTFIGFGILNGFQDGKRDFIKSMGGSVCLSSRAPRIVDFFLKYDDI
jgi:hypothetical protein